MTSSTSKGGVATLERFTLPQNYVPTGEDIWLEETSTGHKTFKVDGNAAKTSNTFVLTNEKGAQIARINGNQFPSGDHITIERTNGGNATVYPSPVITKDRTLITIEGGPDLHAVGNVTGLEYEIQQNRRHIAAVSREASHHNGFYVVEVEAGTDAGLVVAIAACLNMLTMPRTL
jgi:uncharacterized protein YxjI